mgnify:CR=1 FL=1
MKESMDQEISWYEDAWRKGQVRGRGRGQGNFKLAANFGYDSRGSADPRESLRKCWISKLALNAHKVFPAPGCVPSVGWVLTTGRDGVVVCYTFSITL